MNNNFARFKAFYKTASLWSGSLLGLQQFPLKEFDFSHLNEEEALELPAIPQGTVLGKRAEYFFKFCIEKCQNYDLVLSNAQIFNKKVTIGELDYIVQETTTGQLVHIELVYKFYIYNPDFQSSEKDDRLIELSKYRGPKGRDNLIRKINHLKNHQLPLLYHPETEALLNSHSISIENIKQQVCFLAHVFIPHKFWNFKFKYINKACIVGYYFNISAFAKAETQNTYYLPEKFAWKMSPYPTALEHTFHEVLESATQSLERGFAPLVWMQLETGKFERFFIVK